MDDAAVLQEPEPAQDGQGMYKLSNFVLVFQSGSNQTTSTSLETNDTSCEVTKLA